MIEAVPTNYPRQYTYSKRVLYVDQEFFAPTIAEMYDQQGELWKGILGVVSYTNKPYAGYPTRPIRRGKYNYEDKWPFVSNWVIVDIQQIHATTSDMPSGHKKPLQWRPEWYFNEDVSINKSRVYTPNFLMGK